MRTRSPVVLLVDDDAGDRELTRRALQQGAARVDLRMATDGEQALAYLLGRNGYADRRQFPLPDLMLLDLNMPRMDGREVLEQIRRIDTLRSLPVVVLTTSDSEIDVARAYQLNCHSFVTKPAEPDRFIRTIRQLESYWFELVTLP